MFLFNDLVIHVWGYDRTYYFVTREWKQKSIYRLESRRGRISSCNDTVQEIKFGKNKGVGHWTMVTAVRQRGVTRQGGWQGMVDGSGRNKPVLRDWLHSLLSNWFPAVETSSSLLAFPPSLRRKQMGTTSFCHGRFSCVPFFCSYFLGRLLFSLVVLIQCTPVSTWGKSYEIFAAFFVRRLAEVHVLSMDPRGFPGFVSVRISY